MQPRKGLTGLLQLTAAIEIATGLTLIAVPTVFVWLLFGDDVIGVGVALGRLAGCALLALGIACWPARNSAGSTTVQLRAMLTYNVLVTVYLLILGLDGGTVGLLLWPGVALHGILSLLLACQ